MTTEQKKLVEDNHNLIYSFLRKVNLDIEDYYDLAAIGLCKAAKGYNPDKGLAFSTFAYRCMRNQVGQEFRKENMQKRSGDKEILYYDKVIENEDGSTAAFRDLMPAQTNVEEEVVTSCTLRDALEHLDNRSRRIFYLLSQGYTQCEIAAELGISQPSVGRIQRKSSRQVLVMQGVG